MTEGSASSTEKQILLYDIHMDGEKADISSAIESALSEAEREIEDLQETPHTVRALQPQCDKLDYVLAASSGVLCGIFDIFLVGKPSETPLGDLTDKWFEDRVTDFATLCGWGGGKDNAPQSALRDLER